MIRIALISVVILLVALFSIQNSMPVRLSLLFWDFEASLAILIFLTFLGGVIAGVLIGVIFQKKNTIKR